MKKMRSIMALLLSLVLLCGLAACSNSGDKTQASKTGAQALDGVLIIASGGSFEEKWNPFIADSAYDAMILKQIFVPIVMKDENNELKNYGGFVDIEETDDGSVLYTVKIKEGMHFTDGEEVTIDDYIWSLYVRSDPSYTGRGAMINTALEGVEEYYYDTLDYSVKIDEINAEAEANWTADTITFENFLIYANATALNDWWTDDLSGDIGDGETTWTGYIAASGYETQLAEIDQTDAKAVFELLARVEYDSSLESYDPYTWFVADTKEQYAQANLTEGITVEEISGIRKIDNYTCTVKYKEIDVFGDVTLFDGENGAGFLIPSHYYGEITKGDVSSILSNMEPMGSGPYIWGGFSDNIATCTANNDFFLGTPATGTVRWQYIPLAELVTALVSGQVDIAEPTANEDNLAELDAGGIKYDLTDNAGYGYLGFSTANLPLNVRKGLASLMNRQPAIEGYFGELATVIERPMSTTVSEYPTAAEEYYGYDPDQALKYFEEAGYSQKDGKLIDAEGNQLVVNVYVGGSGEGNHPAYIMLVQAGEDLASLGGELQIQDVNFNVLQAAMNDGTADMFCLAWGAVVNCDKKDQFYTNASQNHFKISDPKLDLLLDQILQSVDFDERSVLVSDMLDKAMDLVIEFPLYQRKNLIAYNTTNLNMDTIPKANAFYSYKNELWKVEVNN